MAIKPIIGLVVASYICNANAADHVSDRAKLENRYQRAVADVQNGDYASALMGFADIVSTGPVGNPEYANSLNWLEKDLFKKQKDGRLNAIRGSLDAAIAYATLADSKVEEAKKLGDSDTRRSGLLSEAQALRMKAKDLVTNAKETGTALESEIERQRVTVQRNKHE